MSYSRQGVSTMPLCGRQIFTCCLGAVQLFIEQEKLWNLRATGGFHTILQAVSLLEFFFTNKSIEKRLSRWSRCTEPTNWQWLRLYETRFSQNDFSLLQYWRFGHTVDFSIADKSEFCFVMSVQSWNVGGADYLNRSWRGSWRNFTTYCWCP